MSAESLGTNIPQGQGVAAGLSGVGTLFNVIGGLKSASAARNAGERAQQAAEFEAAQLDQNAGQAIAASQRTALDERRRAQLVASRALAVAAHGGGTDDPTVQNVIADIEGEGSLRAALALYGGDERARSMRLAGEARRVEGQYLREYGANRGKAYDLQAAGAGASGFATIYSKYGRGGPKTGEAGADGFNALGTRGPIGGTASDPWFG